MWGRKNDRQWNSLIIWGVFRECCDCSKRSMPGGDLDKAACAALYEKVVWDNPTSITILVIIFFIDIMVIVGNCLVIAAVYLSSKLRSVTNLFIVSLAVADLMVGVVVLPFSATWSVFKVSNTISVVFKIFDSFY